jgi:hypothetical protein
MNLVDELETEENRLNQELEDAHSNVVKTKSVLERKIDLYVRYLKKGEPTNKLDRLMLQNKKEWNMSHLLSLIMHIETTNKFSELANEFTGWRRRQRDYQNINTGAALVTFLYE